MFTTAKHKTQSWSTWVQSTPHNISFKISLNILPLNQYLTNLKYSIHLSWPGNPVPFYFKSYSDLYSFLADRCVINHHCSFKLISVQRASAPGNPPWNMSKTYLMSMWFTGRNSHNFRCPSDFPVLPCCNLHSTTAPRGVLQPWTTDPRLWLAASSVTRSYSTWKVTIKY